jgi:DNA/RNA-binding domain of Phe-tRNA-synthetase-like protein
VYFRHSTEIWNDFPELVPGVLTAANISAEVAVQPRVDAFVAVATSRLETQSEGELPETQAWRRAFSRMGLKPTQYRCASEALLRRLRKDGPVPQIHPLIDLCNAVSVAFAVPVAVFDLSKVADYLEVRYAGGSERYESFSGETESPAPQEVIFADGGGRAHARRWTNRQSSYSTVREQTGGQEFVVTTSHRLARSQARIGYAAQIPQGSPKVLRDPAKSPQHSAGKVH